MHSKTTRARARLGAGGAAAVAMMTTAVVAAVDDGSAPAAHVTACAVKGCKPASLMGDSISWSGLLGAGFSAAKTSATTRPAAKAGATPIGRVTFSATSPGTSPTTIGHPQEAPAPTAPSHPAPAPATPQQTASTWTSSLPDHPLAGPVVAAASVGRGSGLVMAGTDGGVFPVGQAGFHGSLNGHPLHSAISDVAVDPATGGYWMVGSDGGVFAFNAPYDGSALGARYPVVAVAATPSGGGYWLVGADGGVFTFGDAGYYGSLSRSRLGSPVVAMAPTPSGHGYRLVSADGGVFAFGDAGFAGSAKGQAAGLVRAVVPTPSGGGYWLAAANGVVFAFGDASRVGPPGQASPSPAPAAPVPVAPVVEDATKPGHKSEKKRAAPKLSPPPSPPMVVSSSVTDYPPGSSGYDISQYQCSSPPGRPMVIAIVQVTGGALYSPPNPCYVQQAEWAGPHLSSYIYMNGLPKPVPAVAMAGPGGNCAGYNTACQSLNFGYNWVRHWVDYSRSVGVAPQMWWLDVERNSGWNSTPTGNGLVVLGGLQALQDEGVKAGVYSSPGQWQEITGGMAIPGLPVWSPGAGNLTGPGYTATNFCGAPRHYSFGGGKLKLVQYGYSGPFPGSYSGGVPYDQDYACPG